MLRTSSPKNGSIICVSGPEIESSGSNRSGFDRSSESPPFSNALLAEKNQPPSATSHAAPASIMIAVANSFDDKNIAFLDRIGLSLRGWRLGLLVLVGRLRHRRYRSVAPDPEPDGSCD